jgi:hypothetical protein
MHPGHHCDTGSKGTSNADSCGHVPPLLSRTNEMGPRPGSTAQAPSTGGFTPAIQGCLSIEPRPLWMEGGCRTPSPLSLCVGTQVLLAAQAAYLRPIPLLTCHAAIATRQITMSHLEGLKLWRGTGNKANAEISHYDCRDAHLEVRHPSFRPEACVLVPPWHWQAAVD